MSRHAIALVRLCSVHRWIGRCASFVSKVVLIKRIKIAVIAFDVGAFEI